MAILVILRVLALVQAAARGCYLEVILGVKSMSRQPPGGPRGGQISRCTRENGPLGGVQAAARGLVQAAARGLVQAAARGTPGCQDLV